MGAGRSKILVDSSMSLDKYEPFPTNSCITTTTIKTWNSFITLKTSLGSFEISHPTQAPAPGKPWCVCLSLIILFIYFLASLWLRGKEIWSSMIPRAAEQLSPCAWRVNHALESPRPQLVSSHASSRCSTGEVTAMGSQRSRTRAYPLLGTNGGSPCSNADPAQP